MVVITCVDNNGGMLFHHRRQSRDRAVREDIRKEVGESCLWVNAYSAGLFGDFADRLRIDESFMEKAGTNQYCFVENVSAAEYEERMERIILYCWNRNYPADFHFDIPLTNKWILTGQEEFTGYSHEKIRKEIYVRRNG